MAGAVSVLGCGDAFGSGGRLQTCLHVATRGFCFLLDCGGTVCIGMHRFGFDPVRVDAVLLSHFHADHYAGVPFLLIQAKSLGRERPLVIAGPPGVEARVAGLYTSLFPGSDPSFPFAVRYLEYAPDPIDVGPLRVTALPVVHVPETLPHALRVETPHGVIGFSGDTEWTDRLRDVARGATIFFCESQALEGATPVHLDYQTIVRERATLDCDRMVLTHMGVEVIAAADRIRQDGIAEPAEDGASYSL